MKTRSEMNLTSGNMFLKVIKFCFPLMLTTIFQLLYTTVDLWTVSKFGGGSLSMSAVGSNGSLIYLIICVLISLSTGANVCISVAKGAGDKDRASRILHTAFVIAAVGGVLFAGIGYFIAPKLLSLMGTPDSIIGKATEYLQIYFLGCPVLMIYNFGVQMLRALGDSKRPLYILIISGVVNVIFDIIFVVAFKMDVVGVGIATVISQLVSAVLVVLWFKYNKACYVNLEFKKLRIHKQELIDILKVGIPAGLQGFAFSVPNVLIQSSLYTITNYSINGVLLSQEDIIAGSAASAQVEGYIFAMLDAFAVGSVSITGQNYGAKNIKNIRKGYWYCITWMLIFWVGCISICSIIPFPLLSIFITESDGIIVENALLAGKERLFLMAFTYWLDGWMDISGCYLRGMKQSVIPAIVTIIGCTGTRILFIFTLFQTEFFHTIFWLYAAFPISWILVNLAYIPIILLEEKKRFKLLTNIE